MKRLKLINNSYCTPPQRISFLSRIAPSLVFYARFLMIVCRASYMAKRGYYDDSEWHKSSCEVLAKLEAAGMRFRFSGMENLEKLEGPCVLIGNHMSIMETLVLPCLIQPIKRITYVVKDSLLAYPVFRHVMKSREPIAVTRTQPREDLKRVMSGGGDRLKRNISVIVFPQTTRSGTFDPSQFSTIGVKLAKKSDVPVIPVALKTDAWQNGKLLKDFGRLNLSKTVHITFGEPISVEGKGTEEHRRIIEFIEKNLDQWQAEEEVKSCTVDPG